MNQQKLDEYKNRLEKERAKLLAEIGGKPEDFGSDIAHEEEEADEAESFGTKVAVASGLKERISDIDMALQKIQEGKYGVCDKCGAEIEPEVLDISPESKLCKKCKLNA